MKVLAVIASNRRNGNVARLAQQILDGARARGHATEILNLYDYEIKNCIGCWKCVEKGTCILNDGLERVLLKLKDADVVILGSPVYWGNVTGIMKTFFDRHTGNVMSKPKGADEFSTLGLVDKVKMMIGQLKKYGPYAEYRGKKYIIVTASTVPGVVGYLNNDLRCTLMALKIYVSKMKGSLVRTVAYTDSLFKLSGKRQGFLMKKAYQLGSRL
jgi:multimeric flavodoxin WrbA